MSTNNITESIFDSISLIVEKRIANLEYDKTLICTIVDDSEATQKGIYTVSDGSTRFKAQGDSTAYKKDDQVRVLIPRGDFTEEKFIQGKYNAESEISKPITYVSPLGSVLKITDNLLAHETDTEGIVANGAITEKLVGEVAFTEDYRKNKDIFDTLYLKAEFQTNFSQYDMREGEYGLGVKIVTFDESDGLTDNRYGVYRVDFRSNHDMFGNPYAFKIFTSQEIKYELSQWPDNVVGLQVVLYQNNDFKYFDDSIKQLRRFDATGGDSEISFTPNTINVKNVQIGFGSEVTNTVTDRLKLYTNDIETYHSESDTEKELARTLKVLWYNRSEDNEYIGFSDQTYYDKTKYKDNLGYKENEDDPNDFYDEEKYLKISAANTRLMQRKTTLYREDEISLTLAANIYDIKSYAKTAADLIGEDLSQVIKGFKAYTFGIEWIDPFAILLDDTKEKSISKYSKNITDTTNELVTYYDEVLKYAKTLKDKPEKKTGLHNALVTYINNIIAEVDAVYEIINTTITTGYKTYQSIYDTYNSRWNKIKEKLISLKDKIISRSKQKINNVMTDDENILSDIIDNKDYFKNAVDYEDQTKTEQFIAKWDDKYAIYWYKHNGNLQLKDPFMEAGWERMSQFTGIGLPAYDSTTQSYPKRADDEGVKVYLGRVQKEQYAVVLFHNHKKILCEKILEFINEDEIPDVVAIDAAGALSIQHNNEHSLNSYQLYDMYGFLMNAADAQKKRELRARFNGQSGKDEQLIGARIYWYIPNISTMINVFEDEVKDFNSDKIKIYNSEEEIEVDHLKGRLSPNRNYLVKSESNYIKYWIKWNATDEKFDLETDNITISEPVQTNPLIYRQGYDCYYRTIGQNTDENGNLIVNEEHTIFPYHVSNYYQQTATQNNILCVIEKDDFTYESSISLTFSAFGNSGTDYTLALNPNSEYPVVTSMDDLFVKTTLYDFENQEIVLPSTGVEFKWVGPKEYKDSLIIQNDDNGNIIGCTIEKKTITNCYNGILRCSIKNVDVEFGSNDNKITKKLNLQTDIAIPYGYNQNLYIEGASSIIYDSAGANPQYYKKPYILYNKSTNEPCEKITWRLEYYLAENKTYNEKTFNHFYLITEKKEAENDEKEYVYIYLITTEFKEYCYKAKENLELCNLISLNYLPRLSINNILIPSGMYITYADEKDKVFPVAIAREGNDVRWAQPIMIIQNTYSSDLINKWDGSLQIDEKNGTILSTMVGAGRKNKRNLFEGVLMGDVGTGSGNNAINIVGLYGFHDGSQSFGFKVDGTAFLGKNGGGRIYMDGNNAFLYSQTWLGERSLDEAFVNGDPQPGTAGMLIDLKNGYIDAYNFKLTSGSFVLSNSHIEPGLDSALNKWYSQEKGNIIFNSSDKFAITNNGYFFAQEGKIANWTVGQNKLITDIELGSSGSFHMYSDGSGQGTIASQLKTNWMLGIGSNFGVDTEGNIYAVSGKIGPWELTDTSLSYNSGTVSQDNIRDYVQLTQNKIYAQSMESTNGRLGYAFYGHRKGSKYFSQGEISQQTSHKCFLEWYSDSGSSESSYWVGMTPENLVRCTFINRELTKTELIDWQKLIISSTAGQHHYGYEDDDTSFPWGTISMGAGMALSYGRINVNNATDTADCEIFNVDTHLNGVLAFTITPQGYGDQNFLVTFAVAAAGGLNTRYTGDRFKQGEFSNDGNFTHAKGVVPVVWNKSAVQGPRDAFYIAIGYLDQ